MFWSASASRAASGTRRRLTRPEKWPSRKASARFSVSRSEKTIVTIRRKGTSEYITRRNSCALVDLAARIDCHDIDHPGFAVDRKNDAPASDAGFPYSNALD